uniref:Putative secreted protein n=1 Tax=Anopheles darlingi TaxID=43151 RepID=A0A2M4D460_ANODA
MRSRPLSYSLFFFYILTCLWAQVEDLRTRCVRFHNPPARWKFAHRTVLETFLLDMSTHCPLSRYFHCVVRFVEPYLYSKGCSFRILHLPDTLPRCRMSKACR